jgi:hypothetical protein
LPSGVYSYKLRYDVILFLTLCGHLTLSFLCAAPPVVDFSSNYNLRKVWLSSLAAGFAPNIDMNLTWMIATLKTIPNPQKLEILVLDIQSESLPQSNWQWRLEHEWLATVNLSPNLRIVIAIERPMEWFELLALKSISERGIHLRTMYPEDTNFEVGWGVTPLMGAFDHATILDYAGDLKRDGLSSNDGLAPKWGVSEEMDWEE